MINRLAAGLAVLGLALGIAACGSSPPSTDPAPAAPERPPTACIGLAFAQCEQALAALSEHFPGETPSYVTIAERFCDGPCPGLGQGGWLGHLTVEFIDGRNPQTILITVDGARVEWEPIDTVLIAVEPGSERLAVAALSITTGHCGLNSPLDLDGSYWDPVGAIPADHPDRINSAEGTFLLTSPDTATLRTLNGLVVQLVRHRGPKFIPACD